MCRQGKVQYNMLHTVRPAPVMMFYLLFSYSSLVSPMGYIRIPIPD